MVEKTNTFSEEDAATLIQRYEATTVLTLLQEVAHYPPHLKIDWNELVKKTSTGISNAREYQMLWRHLAYRDALPEKLEDGAEPLNDDSDLECELEALPPTSSETALEARACVKVIIASGVLSESSPSSSTIEAPLTINVPVCRSSRTPTDSQPSYLTQGTSVIFPVCVQRQTLPTVSSTEGVEAKGSGGGNMPYKRKRKAWSEEEDKQLRAAVQRYGEGNWAAMLKGDNFPIKRTPTQLAQRWSILRKKDGNTNLGAVHSTSSQYTAEQLATLHSLSLALDMPFKKLNAPGMTDSARMSLNTSVKIPAHSNAAEGSTIQSGPVLPQHLSQPALLGSCSSLAKSKVVPVKTAQKSNLNSDSAVRATAVAAGARIVSPSDTASTPKDDHAIKAAHIMPAGSSIKSSFPAGLPTHPTAHSNVPHICTVAVIPASGTSAVEATSPTIENPPTALSNRLSEPNNCVKSVANEVLLKQEEVNATEKLEVSDTSVAPKERVQEDEAPVTKITPSEEFPKDNAAQSEEVLEDKAAPNKEILEDKAVPKEEILDDKAVPKNTGEYENQRAVVMNSNLTVNTKTDDNHPIAVDNLNKEGQELNRNKTTKVPVNNGGECHSVVNGCSEDQSMNEKTCKFA